MKQKETLSPITGKVVEEEMELTLAEICRASHLPAERVIELVEYGVIEPIDSNQTSWRFAGVSLRRVQCVQRLQQDLGVNTAGAALALDLLEELEQLRIRLRRLER